MRLSQGFADTSIRCDRKHMGGLSHCTNSHPATVIGEGHILNLQGNQPKSFNVKLTVSTHSFPNANSTLLIQTQCIKSRKMVKHVSNTFLNSIVHLSMPLQIKGDKTLT